ncbi:MAG: PH domain-containing protein [Acidimicrobiales bacterium]
MTTGATQQLGDAELGRWQRVHPLSPVISGARVVPALLLAVAVSRPGRTGSGATPIVVDGVLVAVVVVLATIRWLVTRWRIDGTTLRIETGLVRRDSRQLPLTRIQAVDLVQPLAARLVGLAELRVRLAGSSSADGRLAFLPLDVAGALRARLLAVHHGLDAGTPEPAERPLAAVPAGRLVGSVLLSGPGLLGLAVIVTLAAVSTVSTKVAAAAGGASAAYLLSLGTVLWRRLSAELNFAVADAPDGLRIRRGLLQTVAETVPFTRVQGLRVIEPLLWRPMNWCRVEVDIAGPVGRDRRGEGGGELTRALLPVGSPATARALVERVMGTGEPTLSPPPSRARLKTPLSYHFLRAGTDHERVVAVVGRVRRTTSWIPLTKVQSVRTVEGPLQRRLGLKTLHVDAAGRRVRAVCRDRDASEADRLVFALADASRAARRAPEPVVAAWQPATVAAPVSGPSAAPGVAPGWYRDPAGRHQVRWFDGAGWTAHVGDDGVAATDPL